MWWTLRPWCSFSPPSTRSGTYYSGSSGFNPGTKKRLLTNNNKDNAPRGNKFPRQLPHKSYAQATKASFQGGGDVERYSSQKLHNFLSAENDSFQDLSSKITNLHQLVSDDVEGLDALVLRLEDVETDITHPTSGLKFSITQLKEDISALKAVNRSVRLEGNDVDHLQVRLTAYEKRQDLQDHRLEVLTGLIDRQQKQIDSLKLSNTSNLANTLIDNVIVGGIRQEPMENCRELSADFFAHVMGIRPNQEDIIYAQRMGEPVTKGNITFPSLMKVRCSPYFRSLVWDNRQCLKGKTNSEFGWKYFIDLQRPEVFHAANARYKPAYDKVLKDNESKDPHSQSTPKIHGARLFVDGEIVADPVSVPTPKELLSNSSLDLELLDNIKVDQSKPYTLSDSTFKAFAIAIENFGQANVAYKKVKLENLFATYVIMACAFKQPNGAIASCSCDDGEDMAGVLLERLMKEENFLGYVLMVAQWKLGGNMGQRRFKCIMSVALQVIKQIKTKKELVPPLHQSDKINNKSKRDTPAPAVPVNTNNGYSSSATPSTRGADSPNHPSGSTLPKSCEQDQDSDVTDDYGDPDHSDSATHQEGTVKST